MLEAETLSAPAADPSTMITQMVAELSRSNPQLAMLAQMMQARATLRQSDSSDNVTAEIATLAAELTETKMQLEATQHRARRLFAAHQVATKRLADLAAALGACGMCWGEDDGCPSCRGRGRAGMVRPDTELRARLLGPPRRPPMSADSTV